MRDLIWICLLVTFLACVVGVFWLKVSVDVLLTWGMGGLALAWLVALVTLPWNLHFQAKALLFEMQRSRERGIAVIAERETYAVSVRDRMFRISILAHLFSAAFVALGTWFYGGTIGYYFAVFYLLSTFVRPGFEYHRYLFTRLAEMKGEVKYPREDVLKLLRDVQELKSHSKRQEEQIAEGRKEMGDLGASLHHQVGQQAQASRDRDSRIERQIEQLSRKFEETVHRLTDNQEILAGVKAFLRLVKETQAAGPAAGA